MFINEYGQLILEFKTNLHKSTVLVLVSGLNSAGGYVVFVGTLIEQ